MRMWNLPPHLMCDKHLLGEHVEMHMFIGSHKKGTRVSGYIEDRLLDPSHIVARHDELVAEFSKRNFKHTSPIDVIVASDLAKTYAHMPSTIDLQANLDDLASRCDRCRRLISLSRV